MSGGPQRLGAFLRGARPNPASPGPWTVMVRAAETFVVDEPEGHWATVGQADTLPGALDILKAEGGRAGSPGDLLRVRGATRWWKHWYAIRRDGEAVPVPYAAARWAFSSAAREWLGARAWPEAWAACPSAEVMLLAVGTLVPLPVLARAVSALARPYGALLVGEEARMARTLLDAVDAWVEGRGTREAALATRAAVRARLLLLGSTGLPIEGDEGGVARLTRRIVLEGTENAAWLLGDTDGKPGSAASGAAEFLALATAELRARGGPDPVPAADVVRRTIPFDEVMLGLLDRSARSAP